MLQNIVFEDARRRTRDRLPINEKQSKGGAVKVVAPARAHRSLASEVHEKIAALKTRKYDVKAKREVFRFDPNEPLRLPPPSRSPRLCTFGHQPKGLFKKLFKK